MFCVPPFCISLGHGDLNPGSEILHDQSLSVYPNPKSRTLPACPIWPRVPYRYNQMLYIEITQYSQNITFQSRKHPLSTYRSHVAHARFINILHGPKKSIVCHSMLHKPLGFLLLNMYFQEPCNEVQ